MDHSTEEDNEPVSGPVPDPVYQYSSSSEDNSVESGLQLLKRRRPRNALQLERPTMEAFVPASTSERSYRLKNSYLVPDGDSPLSAPRSPCDLRARHPCARPEPRHTNKLTQHYGPHQTWPPQPTARAPRTAPSNSSLAASPSGGGVRAVTSSGQHEVTTPGSERRHTRRWVGRKKRGKQPAPVASEDSIFSLVTSSSQSTPPRSVKGLRGTSEKLTRAEEELLTTEERLAGRLLTSPGQEPDMVRTLLNLQDQTDGLSKLYRELEEETRTNSRDIGNLQESLVRVLTNRDIKDKINRVGNQAINLLSELKQTQRSVVKCLSEAEQAKKDYDELKHKTEMIMLQLQRCQMMEVPVRLSSRLSLQPEAGTVEDEVEDRNI